MTARGNVVLTTSEGTRMTTQEMRFSNTAQLITSTKLVRVEREGSTLEGVGFSSDTDLRHFEFKSQVDCRATVGMAPISSKSTARPKTASSNSPTIRAAASSRMACYAFTRPTAKSWPN